MADRKFGIETLALHAGQIPDPTRPTVRQHAIAAHRKETKLRLFRMGAVTATSFLRQFNWRDYKRIRRSLAEAYTVRV